MANEFKNVGNQLQVGSGFVAAALPIGTTVEVINKRTDSTSPTALEITRTFTITIGGDFGEDFGDGFG